MHECKLLIKRYSAFAKLYTPQNLKKKKIFFLCGSVFTVLKYVSFLLQWKALQKWDCWMQFQGHLLGPALLNPELNFKWS